VDPGKKNSQGLPGTRGWSDRQKMGSPRKKWGTLKRKKKKNWRFSPLCPPKGREQGAMRGEMQGSVGEDWQMPFELGGGRGAKGKGGNTERQERKSKRTGQTSKKTSFHRSDAEQCGKPPHAKPYQGGISTTLRLTQEAPRRGDGKTMGNFEQNLSAEWGGGGKNRELKKKGGEPGRLAILRAPTDGQRCLSGGRKGEARRGKGGPSRGGHSAD